MAVRGHNAQLIFFATLTKILLCKKVFLLCVFFFCSNLYLFFVSFITFIFNPVFLVCLCFYFFCCSSHFASTFLFLVFVSFTFAAQFFLEPQLWLEGSYELGSVHVSLHPFLLLSFCLDVFLGLAH